MSTPGPDGSVAIDQEALIQRAYARISELTLQLDQFHVAFGALRQDHVQLQARAQQLEAELTQGRAAAPPATTGGQPPAAGS